MALELNDLPGDKVRVPAQRPGVVTVISRYSKERAVLMHPDDFQRFQALDTLLSEAAATEPLAFSDAAIMAHNGAETPSAPIIDRATLEQLFGS